MKYPVHEIIQNCNVYLYYDIILIVKTVFDFKQFFKPDIRQMKPDTGYTKGRISGTTLPLTA